MDGEEGAKMYLIYICQSVKRGPRPSAPSCPLRVAAAHTCAPAPSRESTPRAEEKAPWLSARSWLAPSESAAHADPRAFRYYEARAPAKLQRRLFAATAVFLGLFPKLQSERGAIWWARGGLFFFVGGRTSARHTVSLDRVVVYYEYIGRRQD